MGNVAGWLTGCLFPEEQAPWHAANAGDFRGLRDAIARLTPETRRYLEWQDSCSGRTPLAQAAAKGRLQCVIELVQAGVNVNAKDYKGNTPLHLAARHGHADVVRFLVNNVQVVPFEVNIQLQTPLDVARERLRRRGCDDSSRHAHAKGYEASIEELEKKFYLYSGWVYEKTDNLISAVSGISNLSSWKHRFCIVLQRGLPDILELALFSARKGDLRPTLPSSVILYHVQSGFHEIMDAKWFNRKEYAFTISGSVLQRDGQWEERRRAAPTQAIELAAIDAEGFQMWKSFFHHHEEMLAASRLTGSASYYAPPPPPAAPLVHPPHPPPPAPPMPFMGDCKSYPADYVVVPRQQSGESSRSSITTMSTLRDEDQEEEDLRRAIELSLRESTVMGTQPPQPIESSAPAWTDEETDGLSGSYTGQSDPVSMTLNGDNGQEEKAPALPATSESSRRPPSYSSIGECVVCFDGPQAAVCVPCGHNAVCMTCAEEILETTCECPVCRHPIREVIKLYRV